MFLAKYKKYLLLSSMLMGFMLFVLPIPLSFGTVIAQYNLPKCNDNQTSIPSPIRDPAAQAEFCKDKGGYSAGGPSSAVTEKPDPVKSDCKGPNIEANAKGENHCAILDYLVLFIKFLTGIVGVVVVASIIIGGIQYSMSSDDPSAVAAAKKRILNAILALGVYAFMFALLQYLIPGGVL